MYVYIYIHIETMMVLVGTWMVALRQAEELATKACTVFASPAVSHGPTSNEELKPTLEVSHTDRKGFPGCYTVG